MTVCQLYDDDPTKSGSRLCGCNAGPELKCTWLEEIEKKPCNTESAFYRWATTTFPPTLYTPLLSAQAIVCGIVMVLGVTAADCLSMTLFLRQISPVPPVPRPHQSPHMAASDTHIVLLQFKIHLWSDKELEYLTFNGFIALFHFSHASPFYLAYRGQCLCYSGEFICAKHDTAKGSKKGAKVTGGSAACRGQRGRVSRSISFDGLTIHLK